jgi:hypothetical protein
MDEIAFPSPFAPFGYASQGTFPDEPGPSVGGYASQSGFALATI